MKVLQKPKVGLEIMLILNEEEARALEAMSGYGADAFIKRFYEGLGRAYMEKHEQGLRSLLESAWKEIPPILARLDKAQATFNQ